MIRKPKQRWTTLAAEQLEPRHLMATVPFQPLPERPVQPPDITPEQFARDLNARIEQTREIPESFRDKISLEVWRDLKDLRKAAATENGSLKAPQSNGLPYGPRLNEEGKLLLQVDLRDASDSSIRKLEENGLVVTGVILEDRQVVGWLDLSKFDELAKLAEVDQLSFPIGGITRVSSEGDSVHNADDVRSQFSFAGVDGTGIKVGVISDGVTNRSLVGSELPSINVNSSLPGIGNEGTAMLEIIHDLAPGADLYFSSAWGGAADMINSINWLVAQGVDVIVDDVGFFSQPFFQDGSVAATVVSAIASGVTYVSAAGNDAYSHYQGQWNNNGSGYHLFGSDITLEVFVPAGETILSVLQWSDGWGTSSNNYNLFGYLLVNGVWQQVTGSAQVQDGNDLPFEAFTWPNNTGVGQYLYLLVAAVGNPASRELEIFVPNFQVTDPAGTASDSIFGHPAVAEAIAVGAANYSTPSSVEWFSSHGPSRNYNPSNQTYVDRPTLDGIGIDGVQTKIGQLGYFSNPFNGTSAAAPHIAAIAALLLDGKDEHITPADVAASLTNSANDIGSAGYDHASGWGRFDALAAIFEHKIWMNASLNVDVDDDGYVTPLDALIIINSINAYGSRAIPDGVTPEAPNFIDVDGDYYVTNLDALIVINYLNAMRLASAEESETLASVRLETTSLEGDAVSKISLGESFYLNVYVRDARTIPRGVFSALVDVDFDSSLVTTESPGLEGVGGIIATEPNGEEEQLLYSVRLTATAPGLLKFMVEPSSGLNSDFLLFDRDTAVPLDRVDFGQHSLRIHKK